MRFCIPSMGNWNKKKGDNGMLPKNPRCRILMIGAPKSGKTGSLACLVNSGKYQLRILDLDRNLDPLYVFVDSDKRDCVSVITLFDNLRDTGKKVEVSGEPSAFKNTLRALDHWVDDEGRDFGAVKDWGPDVVLVLDSLTALGEAAFRRRRHVRPAGSSGDDNISDWGQAIKDQSAVMEMLASPRFSCHILVLSHIKELEPKIMMEAKGDSEDIRAAKASISRSRAENWQPHRYPSALGNMLPQEIARFLPAVILVDGDRGGKRVIVTGGESDCDLGVPAKGLAKSLPIDGGLLTIFNAILGTS